MTDTLSRPSRSTRSGPADSARPPRRPVEAGLVGAAWAVCAGLVAVAVPVLLVWAADARSGSGAAAAMRTAGQVWLVAHGAGLQVPGGLVGLTPLGLVALPLALLMRAAGHGARECRVTSLRAAAELALAVAVPYGVLAAVVASLASTRDVHPVAWEALIGGCVVGGIGAFAGAVRAARLWPSLPAALPDRAVRTLVGVAGSVLVLVAAGTLLVVGSLVVHLGRVGDLAAATGPGKVGGLALLVLCLALLPNAAVCGAAWLAGPGFHVGVGTAVGPYGTVLGPVPSLPLLAALPGGPVPTWVGAVAMLAPVGAGAVAGILVARRLPGAGWAVAAREAALVGPGAGVAMGLLGWLSGGAVGGGRLSDVGPSPWLLGLAVGAVIAVTAAAAGALGRRFSP